jgi:hypothetical protein
MFMAFTQRCADTLSFDYVNVARVMYFQPVVGFMSTNPSAFHCPRRNINISSTPLQASSLSTFIVITVLLNQGAGCNASFI